MTDDIAILILRIGIGITFAAHGAQKVFGWWGGPGIVGWRGALAGMGFHPAPLLAWVSALIELVGGLLLILGALTPLVAMLLVGQSIVIIFGAHWAHGFFNHAGGYEFPLALGVGVAALLLLGPGSLSVDAGLGFLPDQGVRIALLLVGVVGGIGVLALRQVSADRRPSGA